MIIAMCCTRNWYEYQLVNIYSLILTNKIKKIYMIIEDDEYKPLKLITDKIEFININNISNFIKETSPNYNTKYSKLSMCRIYFTKILKEDKILYIDADAIVIDDISYLWDLDLKDNVLAGVKENGDWDKHLWTKGLNDKYINSGVLLMDLKKIREEHLDDSMLYLVNNNKYEFPDQDVINLVCRNRIEYVSNEYNSTETTGIVSNAKIVHYIRGNKGWVQGSNRSEIWFNKLNELLKGYAKMIKIRITGNLSSLRGFETCLDDKKENLKSGVIKEGTILYVDNEMFSYINGANALKKSFCEYLGIEELKETEKIEVKLDSENAELEKETEKKPKAKKK